MSQNFSFLSIKRILYKKYSFLVLISGLSVKNRLSVKLSIAAISPKFSFQPLNNNKKSFLSFFGFYHPLISKNFVISQVLQFSMWSSERATKTWYVPKFLKKIEGGIFEAKTSKKRHAIFFSFFPTRPSDEYDPAPSRKNSRPLLDLFACIGRTVVISISKYSKNENQFYCQNMIFMKIVNTHAAFGMHYLK